MDRLRLLNELAAMFKYKRYLEIGVGTGRIFRSVVCADKVGVEPNGRGTEKRTSDDYFDRLPSDELFDLVFVDGMHEEEFVDRDVENSLKHLSPGGTIVLHDCNPLSEWLERPSDEFKPREKWYGTVWRSFAKLRMSCTDLFMVTIDADCGLGVIRRGKQRLFPVSDLSYDLLEKDRVELLRLFKYQDMFLFLSCGWV